MRGGLDRCFTTESTESTEVVGGGGAADFADDADGEAVERFGKLGFLNLSSFLPDLLGFSLPQTRSAEEALLNGWSGYGLPIPSCGPLKLYARARS